ncbi:MAG: 3D domain-containing protein [Bdellovibrionia bacterium]
MRLLKLLLIFNLGFITTACAEEDEVQPAPAATLTPTVYYKPVIDHYTSYDRCAPEEFNPIRNREGEILFSLCEVDRRKCVVQGTCLIQIQEQEFLLNIDTKIDGEFRFKILKNTQCHFGMGVRNICLDPFYSVAADLKFHKPGDVLFIPALKGVKLPDETIHDGYVIVRDAGGGIVGEHRFDFFTGYFHYLHRKNPFYSLGLTNPEKRFQYEKVDSTLAEEIRKKRAYPKIPKNN